MLYAPYTVHSCKHVNLTLILAAFKAYLSDIHALKAFLLNITSSGPNASNLMHRKKIVKFVTLCDSLLQTRELNLIIVLAAFKAYISNRMNIHAVKALLLNITSSGLNASNLVQRKKIAIFVTLCDSLANM